MCFPWYVTSTLAENRTRLWFWSGIDEYPLYAKTYTSPLTLDTRNYRTFKGVQLPTMKGVFLVTIIFFCPGSVGLLVAAYYFYKSKKEELENSKVLFGVCAVTFVLLLIGFAQFFRFQKAWKIDVDPGCVSVGPCGQWLGKADLIGNWGPGLGWWFSLAGFSFSFFALVAAYLHVKQEGGFCG